MGLSPLPAQRWLPFAISAQERSRKQALLAEHPGQACGRLPRTAALEAAEQALATLVARAVPGPAPEPDVSSPLLRAALMVPDDLCLLLRTGDADDYRLASACVCAPSYWSLRQMLGRTLPELHAGVADMTPALAGRMNAFFRGLRGQDLFERRNWSVHGSPERWQPRLLEREVLDDLWLRSERQTLRRVSAEAIAFTIRVEIAPLRDIDGEPEVRSALERALSLLHGPVLAAFGGRRKLRRVQQFLAELPER